MYVNGRLFLLRLSKHCANVVIPCRRVRRTKLTGPRKEIPPAFYGIFTPLWNSKPTARKVIILLTKARNLPIPSAIWNQPTLYRPIYLSILILSCHLHTGLPSGFFPSGVRTKTLYVFLFSSCMPHARPIYFLNSAGWVHIMKLIHYVYWTAHHLDSWIKIDQLGVTCFIISLFNAKHVSNVSTSIFRNLRLICWVISWVLLLWFDVCWCYGVVRVGWCGILKQAEALVQ